MRKISLFVLSGMLAILLSIVNNRTYDNGGISNKVQVNKDIETARPPEPLELDSGMGNETINTKSTEFLVKECIEAYGSFLGDFSELTDYEHSDFALRDLDDNGVPELIITQVHQVDGILTVYSYNGAVYQIGTYSDPKIGVSALRTSNNPKFPGLFNLWWGGGVEHYGYVSVHEDKLMYEDLWYIDRSGELPYQNEISQNKELINESLEVFSDDDYIDNFLETHIINDENISEILSYYKSIK